MFRDSSKSSLSIGAFPLSLLGEVIQSFIGIFICFIAVIFLSFYVSILETRARFEIIATFSFTFVCVLL